MAQEFVINSRSIETRLNTLLPSQAGEGAGIDFSASTMIIPTIDVTAAAQGATLREDLQTSFSFTGTNSFIIAGATNTTIITTTGYYKIQAFMVNSTSGTVNFNLFDGSTIKILFSTSASVSQSTFVDFNVFLSSGDSLRGTASAAATNIVGSFRQIADITGTLVNPS